MLCVWQHFMRTFNLTAIKKTFSENKSMVKKIINLFNMNEEKKIRNEKRNNFSVPRKREGDF